MLRFAACAIIGLGAALLIAPLLLSTYTSSRITKIPLRHAGLSYRFPFHTEKKTYPYFDPIAQKPFDVNYGSQEDVNGLTTYRFTQNVGYNADGRLVAPVVYPSLYPGNEDGKVTAS